MAKGSSANGSAGSLELSDKNLFFCAAEVKDDKKQTPQEELLTKNGYKAFLEKDYKGAEKQYKELLDLEKKLHGADSKEVARTLDALGSACEKDERYADAKGYYKQGAEVCAKAYGKDKSETGTQIGNVAQMDHKLKNWKEAAAGYKDAIQIYEKNDPSSDNYKINEATKALKDYAEVLGQLGDKKGAEAQQKRAKEIYDAYLHGPSKIEFY